MACIIGENMRSFMLGSLQEFLKFENNQLLRIGFLPFGQWLDAIDFPSCRVETFVPDAMTVVALHFVHYLTHFPVYDEINRLLNATATIMRESQPKLTKEDVAFAVIENALFFLTTQGDFHDVHNSSYPTDMVKADLDILSKLLLSHLEHAFNASALAFGGNELSEHRQMALLNLSFNLVQYHQVSHLLLLFYFYEYISYIYIFIFITY